MKTRINFNPLVFALALTCIAVAGCHKKPLGVTPLPGYANRSGRLGEPGPGGLMEGTQGIQPGPGVTEAAQAPGGIAFTGPGHAGWAEDREMFKSETVYFDYDKSAIKATEKSKIESVASYLKQNSAAALKVEGNCDERGTEEYNRALGERRALAIREYLVHSGIAADRVDTISYGEDRPAENGHDESAWKKNRRGDFVVLTAPK